jgi:hypothetical protein
MPRRNALWHAVVALEEGADLARELAGSVEAQFSQSLRKEAEAKKSLAKSIRGTLETLPKITSPIQTMRAPRKNGEKEEEPLTHAGRARLAIPPTNHKKKKRQRKVAAD